MATDEAATMTRKIGKVRRQRKVISATSVSSPKISPFFQFALSYINCIPGSSLSALLDIKGPSPGLGAGVIHLLCAGLELTVLVLRTAASLRPKTRGSANCCDIVVLALFLSLVINRTAADQLRLNWTEYRRNFAAGCRQVSTKYKGGARDVVAS
jgi:hypothetical protein